jgi:hypothetical protein
MTEHIEAMKRLPEDGQEGIPVYVIEKNGCPGVAAGCHVVDGTREFYAERSGHELEIT